MDQQAQQQCEFFFSPPHLSKVVTKGIERKQTKVRASLVPTPETGKRLQSQSFRFQGTLDLDMKISDVRLAKLI